MNQSWLLSLLCAVSAQKAQSALSYIRKDFFWECAYFFGVPSLTFLEQEERECLIADVTKSKSAKGRRIPVYQCTLEAQMAEMNKLAKLNYLSLYEVKSSYYQWTGHPDLDQVYSLELYSQENFVELSFEDFYGCCKLYDHVKYYICIGY